MLESPIIGAPSFHSSMGLRPHVGDATICQRQSERELRICCSTEFQPHTGWVTITAVHNSNNTGTAITLELLPR
jgi:hypothetical protein